MQKPTFQLLQDAQFAIVKPVGTCKACLSSAKMTVLHKITSTTLLADIAEASTPIRAVPTISRRSCCLDSLSYCAYIEIPLLLHRPKQLISDAMRGDSFAQMAKICLL